MRSYFVPLVGVLILASIAHAERTFPYTAYITVDEVYVRSGPGNSYYPTAKLKAGEQVEVYRHDPGGWCAIRPTEGSFTWVSDRFVKRTGNGLGVVTADRVAARVGSQFSDIRDVVQVRLHEGEAVEILGEKPSAGGSGSRVWYQIAPPSGEFRWVSGKYVDADYPSSGIRKASADDGPLIRQGQENAYATAPTDSGGASVRADGTLPPAFRSLSPEEFQQELADLDMELSIMVAEEPTVWTFDELEMRARSMLAQAETAVERGRARVAATKIARFADIKQRFEAVDTLTADTARRNRLLADLSRNLDATGRQRDWQNRFDGQGRLTRVVSPKPGAPRYALTDDAGGVRCYVTPAPGVDLRQYIGREVGVTGVRGYMPEQRAQHVMAKRIQPVEETLLR